MTSLSNSLLRIMYAPLDYVHPRRFRQSGEILSSGLKQAINHHLIKIYKLPTILDFTVGAGDVSHRLVHEWNLLPLVAWLLGCKIARGSLAMRGQLAAFPDVAQRFVALPIPCPAYPPSLSPVAVSKSELELIGARYLYQLQSQLPAALAQRLPLVFAPDSGNEDTLMPELTLNRSLLTFAFDYAKNYSH